MSLYSGALFDQNDPYLLHVTVVPPPVFSCPARTFPHAAPAAASLPESYPDGLNTLFLLNTQRLAATYGQAGADQVQASVDNLVNYLNGSGQSALGVTAAALPVDGSADVRDQYAAWDQNPCSTAAANATVKSITGLLQSIRQTHPNLKYLVMVGGDDQIPLARIPDLTSLSNETDYASTFAASPDELFGSLATGDILSDDVYGDTAPFAGTDENRLFLPRIAVGRLVETPDQIAGALDRFRDPTVRGALDATTGLVTGYDFLTDGAQAVASALQANLGAGSVDSSLIDPFDAPNPWTLGQLQAKVFPASGASPDILSLNGHYDHQRALPSAGNQTGDETDLFTTDDLAAHPGALAGRLVFTMGCHAGLQVPDVLLSSGDPLSKDWAEGYAQQGALLAANTGYGLGDTNTVAYSERLMALFAKRLDGSLTIGQALAAAKADYYSSLGVIGVYDAKVMQEAVFYGLPFYSVGQSPIPAARPAARADALPIGTDPVTGLAAAQVTLDPSFQTHTARDGSVFFTVGDETPQVTHYRPLQPKTIVDVTQPASVGLAHGALVTALASSDQTRTITVDRPTVDEADAEPASAFGTVAFPSKLQTLATTTGPSGLQQTLVLVPGQFLSDGLLSAGRGTQRLYSHVAATVLYSGSTDFDPPAIGATSANVVSGPAVALSVDASSDGAVVKRVLVLYHDNDAAGTWRSVDLADGGAGTWTATAPLSAAVPSGSGVDYSVQVVDAAGNVAVASGKSTGFVAPSPQTPADVSVGSVQSPGASGWFKAPVTLHITHPGSAIQYQLNGSGLQPYDPAAPPTLSASGVYTVDAVADDGAAGEGTFQVDLDAPTITSAAASLAFAQNGFVGTPFGCADALSGVASCQLTKPIAVNKPGKFTFTVQATDVAGNTATLTVPYIVDGTAPKVTLTVPANGKSYKVGKNVVVRYTCHDPVQKKVSSGLAACEGQQPSGSKLDTSKPGSFTFTVTARDGVGHVTTTTKSYTVVAR